MRKSIFVLMIALLLICVPVAFGESDRPYRNATAVNDVNEPYTADDWIISPDEEPAGDELVSNAPECDIKGVIACYDQDFLRLDILLNHSVTYDFVVWYAVEFEYEDMNEYYTYYPLSKTLIYEKEVDGKITETTELSKTKTDDWAGVTDSSDQKNDDIYIIISKESHMSGNKGKHYFLTTYVMAGYVDKKDKMKVADDTIKVDLDFER